MENIKSDVVYYTRGCSWRHSHKVNRKWENGGESFVFIKRFLLYAGILSTGQIFAHETPKLKKIPKDEKKYLVKPHFLCYIQI